MPHPFDPGYIAEPFLTLCAEYPEATVYPPDQFRLEWGPIFHRGRLDGSARILVIGQDPAQHETVVRRILVGEAGRRVQGLLAKLGIVRSYVFINTYLYSVFGTVKAKTRKSADLVAYRNRWLDALLIGTKVEAVVALGQAADEAWTLWKATRPPQSVMVGYAAVTHPTQPESSSGGDRTKLAAATKKLLQNWNAALQSLSPSVQHPDFQRRSCCMGTRGSTATAWRFPRPTSPPDSPRGCTSRMAGRSAQAPMCSPSDATSPSLSRRESFHERRAASLVSTRRLGAGDDGTLQPSEYGQ